MASNRTSWPPPQLFCLSRTGWRRSYVANTSHTNATKRFVQSVRAGACYRIDKLTSTTLSLTLPSLVRVSNSVLASNA